MPVFGAPTSEEALRQTILDARADNTSLRLVSGGTRYSLGRPVDATHHLDLSGLTGITRYDPGSLTIEALAGTPMATIHAALAAENQMLAFEPMDHRALLGLTGTPSIGGVVAGNVSGPRRFISGACRDFLLGVRFVDGQGQIVKNGGRVMKNVTGLDLSKLSCGAFGTLGVLSELALKVLPRPETALTIQFNGLDEAEAVKLFCKAVTTPFEVSGAAWQNGSAYLRVEGLESQVTYRRDQLLKVLGRGAGQILQGEAHDVLWEDIRDLRVFAGTDDVVWKISLKATMAPALIASAKAELSARAVMDHGGATLWLAVPSHAPYQAELLRGLIPQGAGYATLIRASDDLRAAVPVFHPEHPRLAQIAAALRLRFDADGLLNPGLMAV